MSNNAQAFSNPLVRKRGTRDGRALDAADSAKLGQQNVGMFSRPLPGGVSTISNAQSRTPSQGHPFRCLIRQVGGDVQVEQGTINGKSAVSYTVNIADTGTQVIYVKIEPEFTDVEEFIVSATFDDFEIEVDSEVPADTDTLFYRTLATYVNGKKVGQPIRNSLEVAFCGTINEPQARWGLSG